MPLPAIIAIGFAAGAALAPLAGSSWVSGPAALLVGALWGVLLWKRRGPRALLLLATALLAGHAARSAQLDRHRSLSEVLLADLQPRLYSGEVLSDLGSPLERRRLQVRTALLIDGQEHPMVVELWLRDAAAGWPRFSPGTRIRFRARLVPPQPAWMAGQFDGRALARARGVHARASLRHRDQLAIWYPGAQPSAPDPSLQGLRQSLLARVDAVLDEEASALTRGVVLGDRSDIDQTRRAPFDGAGAGHLLAVSGLHVGSFAALVFVLAGWLARRWEWLMRRVPPRRFGALLAAPAGLGFALLAGASPSALRAGVMTLAVLIGVALWRPRATTSALGLAALAILAVSPAAVADPSFVLSFGAVIAILYGTPRLVEIFGADALDLQDPRVRLLGAAATSLAAGLISLPLAAYYFGRLAPYGVPANIALIPLAAIALPLAIATVLFGAFSVGWLPGVGAFFIQLGAALVVSLRDLCGWVAGLPGALVEVRTPSLPAVLLCLLGLSLLLSWKRQPRTRLPGLATLGLGLLLAALPALERPGLLRVAFLPVGQGDATLVRTPGGRSMLVDTGSQRHRGDDAGTAVVLPYLAQHGISRLDVVALSHPDADHYNGLATVIAATCPAEFWWTGQADTEPAWIELERALEDCGTRRRRFAETDRRVELGGLEIEVLHPLVASDAREHHWPELGRNDNSLVLLLRHGDTRLLLTGDAGALVEASLLDRELVEPVDLLKCGHHGSKHSSSAAFLAALQPAHAVISAGYANRFGHPAAVVMERLAAQGPRVWRTDRQGLIEAVSDGEELWLAGYRDDE